MVAQQATLPPPTGGWDVRNALANMPVQNAPVMDNWFPDTEGVLLRPGYTEHATGMTDNVDTLIEYAAVSGQEKLFAANAGNIYDVTNAGAVGAPVASGFSNDRWQQTQTGTAGGQFSFICNGADVPQVYDGTTWAATTLTGPTLTNVVWCNLHQTRLWIGEKDSLDAWYGAPDAITGAFTKFPLGATSNRGGFLVGMGTWTRDAGDGSDDIAVFLTSEGEAIIYQGTDPASAATWSLIGVFRIGNALGRRSWIKGGSDLIIATESGYLPLSAVLPANRSQYERLSISTQIDRAVNAAVRQGANLFGWQPFIYPRGTMLIFNVPRSESVFEQHVFNTITNAPCRFTNIPARTWALLQDDPYFGSTDGKVYRFDFGTSDNGDAINGDVLQAFNYFGSPGVNKAFKMVEPVISANGNPPLSVGLNLDFTLQDIPANFPPPDPSVGTTAVWGVSKWGQSTWGTSRKLFSSYRGVRGIANAAGIRMKITTGAITPLWTATNVVYEPGGQIRRR